MSRIKVADFPISVDGFGAGRNRSKETPLGTGREELHNRMLPAKRFRSMSGKSDGTEGIGNSSLFQHAG